MLFEWNGEDRLDVAILVDVDGTLAGIYRSGKRPLRGSAVAALKLLSGYTPVFLWSIVGADNPKRLLRECPHLRPYVAGCYGKKEFPLHLVDRAYCIDDDTGDAAVMISNHFILPDSYEEGEDSGSLVEAAYALIGQLKTHF